MAGVIASLIRHPMNLLKKSLLPNLFSFSQILGKDHAVAYYSYVDELPSLDAELYKVCIVNNYLSRSPDPSTNSETMKP